MTIIATIRSILAKRASISSGRAAYFFKTGLGGYAAHDQFIGVTVPALRNIAKQFKFLQESDLQDLITSSIHEERLLALIILVMQYKKSSVEQQEKLYQFYVYHLAYVNNWNLVDTSAHWIIGAYLFDKDRHLLEKFANSDNLWIRRIAIVSTWYFIRQNDTVWTFKIAHLLLADKEDLVQKAVGWMLREAGKRDEERLVAFLDKYAANMSSVMLRYAIEKFPPATRKTYLAKRYMSRIR